MKPIEIEKAQQLLEQYTNKQVYIHLETTNGAYASHINEKAYNVGAYIRNAQVTFNQAKIVGDGGKAYRVGLKMEMGWIYAEGLTDWVMHEDKLLFAGHDPDGRLMVSFQVSETPFNY